MLLVYRLRREKDRRGNQPDEWKLDRIVEDARCPTPIDSERFAALHLHPAEGTRVCLFGPNGGHDPIGSLPGAGGIVYDAAVGAIVGLAPVIATDPFAGARPAGDINAALARRRVTGWRPVVLRLDSGEMLTMPDDVTDASELTLTGELWPPAGGIVPIGVARDHPDGRRHLGVCLLDLSGESRGFWWDEEYDLHTVVAGNDDGEWALRASTRRHDDHTPLRHELWQVRNSRLDRRRTLDDGREQWRSPVAWFGDALLAAHALDGVRRIEMFRNGRWWPITGTAFVPGEGADQQGGDHEGADKMSVSSAAVAGVRLVTVESAVTSVPSIFVRPLPVDSDGYFAPPPALPVDRLSRNPFPEPATRRVHHVIGTIPHRASSLVVTPAERAPRGAVVFFHGGPTMSWSDWSWRWNPLPFTAHGYAVVLVDPAGSDGYGEAARAVAWRGWREGIVPSALAVMNAALNEHGLADLPLATMGGSFGGYVAAAVAMSQRTLLVAAHATPFQPSEISLSSDAYWSWTREWGPLTDGAAGLGREDLRIQQLDPRTRLMLSHGMADDQVPFHQSVKAARSFRLAGGRADLALLPDVGHAIQRPMLIDQWLRWVLPAFEQQIGNSVG